MPRPRSTLPSNRESWNSLEKIPLVEVEVVVDDMEVAADDHIGPQGVDDMGAADMRSAVARPGSANRSSDSVEEADMGVDDMGVDDMVADGKRKHLFHLCVSGLWSLHE